MWANPVIDIDLLVVDPADEATYVPDLATAGFRLHLRQPEWEEHRLLKFDSPTANVHVFGPDSIEPQRHLAFIDWLQSHPVDHAAYAAHKREVAARGFDDAMEYNDAKAAFIYDLYEGIFAADPKHQHNPCPRD
jgi:GrpB-like predicted nucleotidyltransferase (UPF0157 family)